MSGSFRPGTIAGGTVFVHLSWLIFGALLSWSLVAVWFPALAPGWPPFASWGTALVVVLLVFASVLVHEAAHALIARTQGLSVNSLTLFPFGSSAVPQNSSTISSWRNLRTISQPPIRTAGTMLVVPIHQLAVPCIAMAVMTTAIAAGLKKCVLRQASRYLEDIANIATHPRNWTSLAD